MFASGLAESTSAEIQLEDVDPKAMKPLLEARWCAVADADARQFIYTGKCSLDLSTDTLLELLLVADRCCAPVHGRA